MTWDILPGLLLLLIAPAVWSQCNNTPLSLTLSSPTDIRLPAEATENGVYRHNQYCEWVLFTHQEGLQLEFVAFDLQESPECIFDYLEIYTGSGENERLVDRWCGSKYPNYIVMSHGRIVFRSDDRVAAPGFTIRVKFTAASAFQNVQFPITATETPRLLYSPFYGERNNGVRLNFDWKVTNPDPNMVLQIEYQSMCEMDEPSVQVLPYNSNFTVPVSSDILYHKCDRPSHDAVVSNIPNVLITVRSDSERKSKQFRLSISTVKKYTADCLNNGLVHNVTVSQHPHYLIVPYWQHTQSHSIAKSCQWHVTTNMADHVVAMEMMVYDPLPESVCRDTSIAVYYGASNSSLNVVSACANSDKFSNAQSPEMFIDVHIFQQYRGTVSHRKAFLMKIYAIEMCDEDGQHPLVAKGDRSYAVLNYNRGPDCMWHVKAENVISLKMIDVGVVTLGGTNAFNPVNQCVYTNDTYLQVFRARTTLSQHQVEPVCPIINSQDYRVYETSLYLPTNPTSTMPRLSQSVYYYATIGTCDSRGEITLDTTLTTQSIFSPNYPNLFWPHENCRWRFHSFSKYYNVAFKILSFNSGQTRFCSTSENHIAFYNGYDSNSTRVTLRCAGLGTDWISSMGRYVYAEFKSFYDNGGKFEILYKAVRNDSSCNKELQATPTPKNLSSPGFPSSADRNAECWWRIKVQSEDDVVFVQVLQTDMYQTLVYSDCRENFVEAYDGKDATEGLIIRWCGTQAPSFVSTGKYLYLKFATDSHNNNKGFLLTYNSTKATINHCGSALTAFNYVHYLTSPNYPENYKNHMDCQWNIAASSPYNTVKIEVIDTHLEYDCSFDNVSVYDGRSIHGTLMQTFCAKNQPTLQSSGRNMFIRFQSDSSRTHKGFRLKYYETEDSPPPMVCNKRLSSHDEPMYLESPGYPNVYPSNLNCWWIITASDPSGRVLIEVLKSSIQHTYGCTNDYVAVHDENADGRELGRFCGSQQPTFTSPGRAVFIVFKTDLDVNEMGFRLKYITTKACVTGHVTELFARTFPDYIESPEYPSNYPNDVSCMWRITTNNSRYIQLTVLDSDIEMSENCGYDFMAAYDGYSDSSSGLDKWCGTRTPTFTSSGSVMFVKFRSDGSGNAQGFRLKYAAVNTGNYGSSSMSLKAGTVAGVVCGVFVVTAIMIAVIFIIIRHKHKNSQNSEDEPNRRRRRSRRNWRLQQYQDRGPWEVNQVFYSQESGGLVSPPPYSMVVGSPVPNEPPPPYPAAEFDMSLKDEDEPAPPYTAQTLQTQPTDSQSVNNQSGGTDIDQGPSESRNLQPAQTRDGKGQTSVSQDIRDGTSPLPNPQDARPQPRPHPRPQPRTQPRPQPRYDPRPRTLDQAIRAVSVDNVMSGHQPLSLAPSESELPREQMSAQARAVSLSNLLLPDAPQRRGYDRHVSRSEMVLNQNPASPRKHETGKRERQPLPERQNRHRKKPERPQRQRDREDGRRPRTLSDPDAEGPVTDDRPGPEATDTTSPPDRYTRNPKRNPNDNKSRPRGRRSNQKSEFQDMKQRSRSCDNLNSDRPSLPNNSDYNPRWSVASEGYMNNKWSLSPLGEERYNNPTVSLASGQDRRERTPPRAAPRDKVPGPIKGGGNNHRSRENLNQGNRSRPAHNGSRGNLTVDGAQLNPEVAEVSGYAHNRGNVILNDERQGEAGRGQPTETSV